MMKKPVIVVNIRQGVVELYGNIAADVHIADDDVLQGGSEDDIRKYNEAMAMIKSHGLLEIAAGYKCSLCNTTLPWEKADPVHGELYSCEVSGCGEMFCAACFTERHGAEAYREMRGESDIFRCPDCWEKHVKEKPPREGSSISFMLPNGVRIVGSLQGDGSQVTAVKQNWSSLDIIAVFPDGHHENMCCVDFEKAGEWFDKHTLRIMAFDREHEDPVYTQVVDYGWTEERDDMERGSGAVLREASDE